jgi:hypothetical protein
MCHWTNEPLRPIPASVSVTMTCHFASIVIHLLVLRLLGRRAVLLPLLTPSPVDHLVGLEDGYRHAQKYSAKTGVTWRVIRNDVSPRRSVARMSEATREAWPLTNDPRGYKFDPTQEIIPAA